MITALQMAQWEDIGAQTSANESASASLRVCSTPSKSRNRLFNVDASSRSDAYFWLQSFGLPSCGKFQFDVLCWADTCTWALQEDLALLGDNG
jgi:hypothetical protein